MLSNKLLLAAARGRAVQSWSGNAICELVSWDPSLMFLYSSRDSTWFIGSFGDLHPLLETVKADTQIAGVVISVDAATIFMTECYLYFDNVPSNQQEGIKFEKLSKIIIHSTTGGEPFTISDVQSCWDNINMCYDLFSEDLANWGYTNLTADSYLEFTLELEWYE